MTDLTTIRNIGPAQEKALTAVGITSAQQLRDMGADDAYRPWNDCKGDEKQALRVRFDKIKAESFDVDRSELEAFLNRIGVVEPTP